MSEKQVSSAPQFEALSPLEPRKPLDLAGLKSGADNALNHYKNEQEFRLTLDQEKAHALTIIDAIHDGRLSKEQGADIFAARYSEMRVHSDIDYLTNIYNRKGGSRRLLETLFLASRNKSKTSMMILDMDGFKLVNDDLGHEAGDRALQALGGHLGTSVRGSDIPYRYGGDEFVVILPNTDILSAKIVAGKITLDVWKAIDSATESFGYKIKEPVTLSIGLAEENPDQTVDQTITSRAQKLTKLADQATLVAKRLGKKRVVLAKDAEGLLTFTDISDGNIYTAIFNKNGEIKELKFLMHG